MAKLSITGSARPVCRYAMPSSVMNLVGEWVGGCCPPGPRHEGTPPADHLGLRGHLLQLVVGPCQGARNAAGDKLVPSRRTAASRTVEVRLVADDEVLIVGLSRAIAAVRRNSSRAPSVSGVVVKSLWNTWTITRMPVRLAASATTSIAFCSPGSGARKLGDHVDVMRRP